MADVLQMNALGMPYLAMSPADQEKDAYIGWLKSEFAAANAIIDSMCQHVQSIGSPGDYDTVFSCLNRRRHSWTATLYMQQFVSVAEIVKSLEQVAQKKQLCYCSSPPANVGSDAQYSSCQATTIEQGSPSTKTLEDDTKLLECQQKLTGNLCRTQQSTPDVSEDVVVSPGNAMKAAGDDQGSDLPNERFRGDAESDILSRTNKIAPGEEHIASSTTSSSNSTQEIHTGEQESLLDLSDGLNVNKLLNMEVAIATKREEDRHALIKRSVQFQCCELVDGQMINDGESVELCESVFSSKEANELVEMVFQLQAAGRRGELGCAFSSHEESGNKPDVIRFGPKYTVGTRMSDSLRMPKSLQAIIKWLTSCGILSAKRRPDSCFISIFNEGDFESPNTDQGAWERPLCVISLLGDCTMVFGHVITTDQQGSCKGPFEVALPIGSVLLLQEKFAGILQKAVPASPSRRIIIAMGKAMSTSNAGLSHMNPEGKARNKQWWGTPTQNGCHPYLPSVTLKQASLAGGVSMDLLPHMLSHHLNGPPLPSIQPIFPIANSMGLGSPYDPHPTVPHGWSYMQPKLQSSASSGTGVFFPSTELNSVSTWQSGFLMSLATGLEVRRSGHLKRAEKHGKVRGSFDSAMLPRKKSGKPANVSIPDGMGCGVTTPTCPSKQLRQK